MSDYNQITPQKAKEITGFTFTEEDLKSRELTHMIELLQIKNDTIKSMELSIAVLQEFHGFCEPKAKHKALSTTINRRSNPESSRPFLRVVS